MRILALETSGRTCRIAVLLGSHVQREQVLDPTRHTAQTLAPGIQSILRVVGWMPRELELVVVTQGPGSFTGLRIGVTTAKTLAYATGAELLGVNTLAGLAQQASGGPIWAVLDAQRQQLFTALFHFDPRGELTTAQPTQIVDTDVWIPGLTNECAVTGPGLSKIRSRLPPNVRVVDEQLWQLRASTVGQIGYRNFQQGRRDDVWKMVPQYFRRSAAEEKRGN